MKKKGLLFLSVVTLVLAVGLPTWAQAACTCTPLFEYFPVTALGGSCGSAAYTAQQIALYEAQEADECGGGVECLHSFYEINCTQPNSGLWQSDISVTIGCMVCN